MPVENHHPRQFLGVMISSTFFDLEDHRTALVEALNRHDLHPIGMEHKTAKARGTVIDSSLEMVREAAAYICIIGRKYGQTPKDPINNPHELSLTELEFNEASDLKRPTLLFIMDESHPVIESEIELNGAKRKKLKSFRERAKQSPDSPANRVYATFNSLESFKVKAAYAIADLRRLLEGEGYTGLLGFHGPPDEVSRRSNRLDTIEFGRLDWAENAKSSSIESPLAFQPPTSKFRLYGRAILVGALIVLATPVVRYMFFLAGLVLSRSNQSVLANVGAGIFDLTAFYIILRIQQRRNAAEEARKRIEAWARTSHTAAFRSLDPYSEADSLPGTDRKRQALRLVTSIRDRSFRFGVVTGEVGCGKTSLLQSETVRLLKTEGFTPILISRSDVADAVEIDDACGAIGLAAMYARGSKNPVLIVDQIEEIFIRFPGRESREKLGVLFGKLIRGDQPCRVICAIRKDYFLDLHDLGATMGINVSPTLFLQNFSPDQAKEVIAECALAEGLNFTEELIGKIVSDLTKEAQIRPPELQIVCTALTANFTLQHYNELGGAKGILESYLTLTLETCIDQHLARLMLRQMCDFERQAKAQPKTVAELTQAVAPEQDDSGAVERTVQLVLDHLVRSRLAVSVNGKVSLIHDYWVSVINQITAHDKSEHEKADELLRRHIYELEAGYSSILNSKQLKLVRRFANRDLLGTEEATQLLRKSTVYLSVSRGVAIAGLAILLLVGFRSSHVVWEMNVTSGPATRGMVASHFLRDTNRLVIEPISFGPQRQSTITVWNIKNGKSLSELTADTWSISLAGDSMLYRFAGSTYFTDLSHLVTTSFPQPFEDASTIDFSTSSNCAIYTSHLNNSRASVNGSQGTIQVRLWSLPDGKLKGSTSLEARGAYAEFVSDSCNFAVLESEEGASLVVTGNMTNTHPQSRPWIWRADQGQLKPLTAIGRVDTAVSDESKLLLTLETGEHELAELKLWDLNTGARRSQREFSLGPNEHGNVQFVPGGNNVVVSSYTFSDEFSGAPPKVRLLRTSDLQEVPVTANRGVMQCRTAQAKPRTTGYFLWSIAGQEGLIWDAIGNEPLHLAGFEISGIRSCSVSPDRSEFVVLREKGTAELWSLNGKKIADLTAAGASKNVEWTLQGSAIGLESSTGDISFFNRDGLYLTKLVTPGSLSETSGISAVSFDTSCKHAFLWTRDGSVVKYTRKLNFFALPYSIPFFWKPANPACDE